MSSIKNAYHAPKHLERAQPLKRTHHHGLLEKHTDYVLRARAYHKKQARITALQQRARGKNEDEFYKAMIYSRLKDGRHVQVKKERNEVFDGDVLKVLKSQDLEYVRVQSQINRKRIEKLYDQLGFIGVDPTRKNQEEEAEGSESEDASDMDDDELMMFDDDGTDSKHSKPTRPSSSTSTPKHVIFVDDEQQVKKFNTAEHFDTHPALVGRTYNRPRMDQIVNAQLPRQSGPQAQDTENLDPRIKECLERQKTQKMRELKARLDRQTQLDKALRELEVQKLLMTQKGKRKRVGTDENGNAIYKWRAERQK